MKESADFGLNKTPTQLHPKMTAEMVEGYKEFPPHAEDTSVTAFDLRADYARTSGQLGSVPLPSTLKGAFNTGMQMFKGNSPAVLIDKLGERLAYERSGTRLYEAFITKCRALDPTMSTSVLERFRDEEAQHFSWVRDCIISIGGDPTAQTPCADASAVMTMGIIQLVNDPRSSLPQCVEAVLAAELVDVAAWELLIELVQRAGLDEYVQKFQIAKDEEDRHLDTIRLWLREMTLSNSAAPL